MKVADIGEGIAEVEVRHWYVKEGDVVKEFDPLCDAKSDKASVTISSKYDGKVAKLYHKVFDVVPIGSKLIDIETAHEGASEEEVVREPVKAPTMDHKPPTLSTKALASPVVRKFALDNNVSLDDVSKWSSKTTVTKQDVVDFVKSKEMSSTNKADEEEIELKGYHRVMFKKMTESLKIPHMVYSDEGNLTALYNLLKKHKEDTKLEANRQISLLAIIVKATSLSLLHYPKLNSSIKEDEKSNKMVLKKYHNIGIAVDTDHGLAVPVVKSVQNKSVKEISEDLNVLISRAKDDKLSEHDVSDATFTISNIGSIGGVTFSPVILPPQIGLLAIGKVKKLKSDESNEYILPVSLAADHRVIDGATTAKFLNTFFSLLNNPLEIVINLR